MSWVDFSSKVERGQGGNGYRTKGHDVYWDHGNRSGPGCEMNGSSAISGDLTGVGARTGVGVRIPSLSMKVSGGVAIVGK